MKALFLGILLLIGSSCFFYRIAYLCRLIKKTGKENRFDHIPKRLRIMVVNGFLQLCHFKIKDNDNRYTGFLHTLIFFGFFVLLSGEIGLIIKGFFPFINYNLLIGGSYKFYLLLQDVFAALVLIAVFMSLFRRFVLRPKKETYGFQAYFILGLLTVLMTTLIYMSMLKMGKNAQTDYYMPIAFLFYGLIHPVFSKFDYTFTYFLHIFTLLLFINYVPNSKHLHILTSIPNSYFTNLNESILLRKIDFDNENIENYGVSKVEDFTWKEVFDGYSCTECGRCVSVCPSANSNKSLVPREIVLTVKRNLFANSKIILDGRKENRIPIVSKVEAKIFADRYPKYDLTIPYKALFECTTCGACQTVCPVNNEHIRIMIDLKRYLIMNKGEFPDKLISVFNNLETNFNPFGSGIDYRSDFAKDLDIKMVEDGKDKEDIEVLYFVGCLSSFDDRGKSIARSFSKILKENNVRFAILGKKEICCGDNARRLGNEYLFYNLAMKNINNFRKHNIKNIVTTCPHGYYTLKYEYPKFGGDFFKVYHSNEYLTKLIKEKGLKASIKQFKEATFHDSCYLGRHANLYNEPRKLLNFSGYKINEMKNSFSKSFCCGGGGGMFFLEESGKRINEIRAKEAASSGSGVIATACPFCKIMLDDGLKSLSFDNIEVMDTVELCAHSLGL